VKSSARQPAQIYLTRNEWNTAVEREPHYRFHVWILPQKELIELTPADIEPHIPNNRGQGVWEVARIAVDELIGKTNTRSYNSVAVEQLLHPNSIWP